jgi:hypothetical protein
MKITLITAITMALSLIPGKDRLSGRWESKPSEKGNVTGVVFESDSTFEAYVNKKPFASGRYTLKNNIFSFTDNGCEGKKGVYKLIFFAAGDSLRFRCIADSCERRKDGMSHLIMGKVK